MDRIPISEQPDNVVRLHGADELAASSEEELSYEEAIAADAGPGADEAAPPGPHLGSQAAELMEQLVRVTAGMFAAAAAALSDALHATLPHDEEAEGQTDPAARLAGAALGAAVASAESAAAAAKQVADTIGPAMTWLVEPGLAKDASEMAAGAARVFDGRWKASQAEMVEAAASFLGALVPATMKGIGGQIDLTALLREHLDVNAIVADVDLDRIIDRLDVDSFMSRIDLDALAERLARKIADRSESAGQT